MQGCVSSQVPCFSICARCQQMLCDLEVGIAGSHVQRCASVAICGIHLGVVLKSLHDVLKVPVPRPLNHVIAP